MNYFAITIPNRGRFVEVYKKGDLDKSWCSLVYSTEVSEPFHLKATRRKKHDVYWFSSKSGIEMAFSKRVKDRLFPEESRNVICHEIALSFGSKLDKSSFEIVYWIEWIGDKVRVDIEKLETLKDRVISVGENSNYVIIDQQFTFDVGLLDHFNSIFIVSTIVKDWIVSNNIDQISLVPIERLPIDAGNRESQIQNDINRLVEQGLNHEEAQRVINATLRGDCIGLNGAVEDYSSILRKS